MACEYCDKECNDGCDVGRRHNTINHELVYIFSRMPDDVLRSTLERAKSFEPPLTASIAMIEAELVSRAPIEA